MRLPGNRIVKTAVAVFLTALICKLIGWPPVFAVITAIVTLEPTVTDSIKKGIIRFPASAIGSFYAVLFIALFENSAITYTLAASLTIITCFRLKLHSGLLVATITAVAMIEVVYDNYLMSFIIRLGTTSVGLVVSTLVNMFIFPPNYIKEIETNLNEIYKEMGKSLNFINDKPRMARAISKIGKKIDKTEELIRYQVNETNFHPFLQKEEGKQTNLLEQIDHLELIHYHIQNLQPLQIKETAFSDEHIEMIYNALTDVTTYMQEKRKINLEQHETALKNLMSMFWRSNHGKETFNSSLLPDELVLLYETISIFSLVKEKNAVHSSLNPKKNNK